MFSVLARTSVVVLDRRTLASSEKTTTFTNESAPLAYEKRRPNKHHIDTSQHH